MKKFYVGVKAIIQDDRGILIIKHSKGYWDLPGGRMDNDEDFVDTLRREISEELPGSELEEVGELQGSYRLHRDIDGDTSLMLVYFQVTAKIPADITFSEEHTSHLWVNREHEIPEDVNPEMGRILRRFIKA